MNTYLHDIPTELRSLAASVAEFESRDYSPSANYCRQTIYGVGEIELSFDDHCANERGRFDRHASEHLSRGGRLLAEAVAAALFADPSFAELCTIWQWVTRRHSENPASAWWGKFWCEAMTIVFILQQEDRLPNCEAKFEHPPWIHSLRHHPIPSVHYHARLQTWLASSFTATAELTEKLIESKQQPRIESQTLLAISGE